MKTKYRGWVLRYLPIGSARWQAERHGVTLRANSPDELKAMIDQRIADGWQ